MEITQHNTTEIKISKVQRIPSRNGEDFFVKRFEFTNEDGEKIRLVCMSDTKEELKSK